MSAFFSADELKGDNMYRYVRVMGLIVLLKEIINIDI